MSLSPKTMRRIAKPLLFAAAIIWGGSFFIMKNTLDIFPVFSLLAVRFTVGGAVLALVCWNKWKKMTADYLLPGAAMGACLFLAFTIQTFGLERTTPSKNAFLTAVYCVIVPFLSWLVVKRKPDRYNILAALLCVSGVGLISLNDQFTIQSGDLLTLVSAFFYAAHIVTVDKVSPGRDISLLTVLQFAFAGLFSWIGVFFMEDFPPMSVVFSPDSLVAMGYLCILSTTVALLFQNVGQIWSDPASAAVILSLESVFGVLFSVLFYGDPLTGRLLMGFALIFVAVVCSETKFSFLRRRSVSAEKRTA